MTRCTATAAARDVELRLLAEAVDRGDETGAGIHAAEAARLQRIAQGLPPVRVDDERRQR